jgi:hypothetical protein
MYELLERELLPEWFEYPQELVDLLESDEVDFGPWQFLHGKWLNVRHTGLKQRYPNLNLVPFARRLDDDDVACFDVSEKCTSPKVKIIHDFASSGWEEREVFQNLSIWLQEVRELAKDWD